LLLNRLSEVYDIVRVKLLAPEGYLYGIALPDWTPQPWPISYGHNIETAHLLISAAARLGLDATREAGTLVNHTLREGFDWERGGIFYTGDERGPIDRSKVWWAQAEALLGFAHGLTLTNVDRQPCWKALLATWDWIQRKQIDHQHGGWVDTVVRDGSSGGRKGHAWKAAYHDGRALMQVPNLIRSESGAV
jgi:mannobiose 2-epimerase